MGRQERPRRGLSGATQPMASGYGALRPVGADTAGEVGSVACPAAATAATRFAGARATTRARRLAREANTPAYLTRCRRGGGRMPARRRRNATGDRTRWVRPTTSPHCTPDRIGHFRHRDRHVAGAPARPTGARGRPFRPLQRRRRYVHLCHPAGHVIRLPLAYTSRATPTVELAVEIAGATLRMLDGADDEIEQLTEALGEQAQRRCTRRRVAGSSSTST
jgi:hypothetical protein